MYNFINIIRWIYYSKGLTNALLKVTFDGKEKQVVLNLPSTVIGIDVGMFSIEMFKNSNHHRSVWSCFICLME